jgi:hypothetical protein
MIMERPETRLRTRENGETIQITNAVLGDLTGQIKVIQENESYQERESSLSKLSISDSVKVSFAKKMGWYKGELGLIVDKYGSIQKISRSN